MGSGSKKRKLGILWWISFVICIVMFNCGACCFVLYYIEANEVAETYDYIASVHDSALEKDSHVIHKTPENPKSEVIVGDPVKERNYLEECEELYKMNSDLVGWISFPETVINYPVVQSTRNNRDFYLDHDFNKAYSRYGCIYASEDCDVFKPSDNITIYGHHMNNGSMFASLTKYESKEYWRTHQYFTFDTLYEHHTYQVVAVFKISAESSFRYHMFTDAVDENDFNNFISNIRRRQFYDTGIGIEYGDKLVCLSTCEYTLSDGRFVVVGKRIS